MICYTASFSEGLLPCRFKDKHLICPSTAVSHVSRCRNSKEINNECDCSSIWNRDDSWNSHVFRHGLASLDRQAATFDREAIQIAVQPDLFELVKTFTP